MSRFWYRTLWGLEIASLIALAFVMTVPVQDYALHEFIEWRKHPSPDTYRAFLEKKRQESGIKLLMAAPFVVSAALIGHRLAKLRKETS